MKNRLAGEKSPYLLQHRDNPVDWWPWGEEAFAAARAQNKPIFLSVGYSTCHWCHVMAHESFENAGIAALLNAHFISVKVDREERPDVDRVYMTFVQATTGRGGWPMSVFLTPELAPFYGGTYFPPIDRYGQPGFATVLEHIARAWATEPQRLVAHGANVVESLREFTGGPESAAGEEELRQELVSNAVARISTSFDGTEGGFGGAPKFPRPSLINLLFRAGDDSSRQMALFTLQKMAAGGMHDVLGGGFHRYSVDALWHVPHFEKMLYDQGQLALSYLEAFQITGDPGYEQVARGILNYVRRDMTAPEGGFYSAEDADSLFEHGRPEHGEGAFYVWKHADVCAALDPAAAAIFHFHYAVEPGGNVAPESDPHREFTGVNVLIARHPVGQTAQHFGRPVPEIERILEECCERLFEIRARRPRPHLDDKILTSWNGLMISAFARAHQVLGDPAYLEAATRAASFVRDHLLTVEGTLLRAFRQGPGTVPGFADDYAFFIQGLLDLYEAGFDIQWLKLAADLQQKQDLMFLDAAGGGYYSVSGADPSILLRVKEDYDGAEPAPSSVSALNLIRLSQMTGRPEWRNAAGRVFRAFAAQMRENPVAMPQMLVALGAWLEAPRQIVAAGKRAEVHGLLGALRRRFHPSLVVLHADGGAGQQWLSERMEFLTQVRPVDGKAAAYVCEDFTCQLPVTDPEALAQELAPR